jgi:hypothetical protein
MTTSNISNLREDVREILSLQRKQVADIATIKSFQITHGKRIDDLEEEQKKNSSFRAKATGAIGILYSLCGLFGSVIAKKF